MAKTTPSNGIVTSFGNTPQAKDDLFTDTGLTEDSFDSITLGVMGNDSGGNAKALWSLDDGNSAGGNRPTDLLTEDTARTADLTIDSSANGAGIWITSDGKIGYNIATLSDAFKAQLQSLGTDEYLTDTLTYAIRLGNGTLSWATTTVRIHGVNDAPAGLATSILATGAEDTAYIVSASDLLEGFSDVEGDTLSIAGLIASDGAVTDNGDGTFTITPTQDFNGAVTLNYDVVDGNGGSIASSQNYTLAAVNDAPVAFDDALSATEDIPVTYTAVQLLGNDTDVDNLNPALSIASVTSGTGGTAVLNGDGTVTFTPNLNFSGAADFTYVATDGTDQSNSATVNMAVAPVNDAPVANNDTNALTVTSLASVTQTNIVNWVDWTSATAGTVAGTINLGNGQTIDVTYTGEYQFTQTDGGINYYNLSNGTEPAGTYTSTAVANGPNGSSDIIALSQATQKTLTFSQPVDNLFFAIVSLNGNGYLFDQDFQIASYGPGYWGTGSATKVALPDGRFEVVGNDELHGVLQIDGSVQSLTWTSQTAENWNGFTIGTYGKARSATISGNLLANDSDLESDAISVAAVNGQSIAGNSITLDLASGARVKVNKDGTYLYDEDSAFGFLGQNQATQDSFQYTVSDGNGGTATATATITVTGINDAPVITAEDLIGAVTTVAGAAAEPNPIVFTVQQYLGFQSNNLATLSDYAASHTADYTVQTNVIDYTDDPGGFAGELPGSSPWPAAVATGDTNTYSTTNNNFFARITANFSVTTADTYTFRTFNDDGVFLLIDNTLVISDTGYHPELPFEGSIALTPGDHSIELFFFENGGEASLEFSAKNSTGTFGLVGASGGDLGGTLPQLTDSGTISFSDADLNDSHIISAITPSAGTLGTLTASVSTDTTGSGVGGVVSWSYNVAAAAVEYLPAGETKVEYFDVTLDDLHGGLITEQIEVTITGASDTPIII